LAFLTTDWVFNSVSKTFGSWARPDCLGSSRGTCSQCYWPRDWGLSKYTTERSSCKPSSDISDKEMCVCLMWTDAPQLSDIDGEDYSVSLLKTFVSQW